MSVVPFISHGAAVTTPLAPTLDYPLNGAIVPLGRKFSWFNDQYIGTFPVHFNIAIADDSLFASSVRDSYSRFDFINYELEDAPNIWIPFPSTGLTTNDYNKRVRYNPGNLATGVYFWRVRVDQIY